MLIPKIFCEIGTRCQTLYVRDWTATLKDVLTGVSFRRKEKFVPSLVLMLWKFLLGEIAWCTHFFIFFCQISDLWKYRTLKLCTFINKLNTHFAVISIDGRWGHDLFNWKHMYVLMFILYDQLIRNITYRSGLDGKGDYSLLQLSNVLAKSVTWIKLTLFLRVFYFPFLLFSNSPTAAVALVSEAAAIGPVVVPLAHALLANAWIPKQPRDAEKEDFANDLVF